MRGRLLLLAAAAVLGAAPVRFAIIGDRTGDAVPGVYEAIVAEVERLRPDFVVTVGDHIQGYTEDTAVLGQEWREYRAIVQPLTMPLHLVPGNHDITSDGQLESYHRYAGEPNYSFDVQGIHITVLDVSRWEAPDKLPAEELDWLTADLAKAKKSRYTLVFFHKPFWEGTIGNGKPDTLHRLFAANGVDVVFSGHYHQYFSTLIDGIKYTAVGSSGGETSTGPTGIKYHCTWVTVDSSGIAIAPIAAGAVRPWDDVTLADIRAIDRNALLGLAMARPVRLDEKLSTRDTAAVVVTNFGPDTLADTLRWSGGGGWTMAPRAAAVTLAPGATTTLRFAAQCAGRPFPVPEATLRMPYAPGKSTAATRSLHASRTTFASRGTPIIDGRVDEAAWQSPITRLLDGEGGPARTDSTRFYFAYDSANLYLAAVCRDPAVNTVKAQARERDGAVYNDDCVGYFFQPDTAKNEVYQVYFSASGVVFDQKIVIDEKGGMQADPKWDGNYSVTTAFGDGQWTIEVLIPIPKELLSVGPGSVMGLNFRRKQPGRKANADWQPIGYDPATFGRLVFR